MTLTVLDRPIMTTLRNIIAAGAFTGAVMMAPFTLAQEPAGSTVSKEITDPKSPEAVTVPDSRYGSDVKRQKKDTRAKDSPAVDAKPRTGVSGPKGARDVDPLKETPALFTPAGDRE
jgi:hypothetical protein